MKHYSKLFAAFMAALLLVVVCSFGNAIAAEGKQKHSVEMVYLNDHQVIEVPENRIEYPTVAEVTVPGYTPLVTPTSNGPPRTVIR